MVDRSGFYINGDKICRVDVKIDWNLGFDKLAKEAYVAELITELSKVCPGMDIAEVTSASPNEHTRMLSPIFIEYRGGTSMEDYYRFVNKDYMALRLGIDKSFVFQHFYCSNAGTHAATHQVIRYIHRCILQSDKARRNAGRSLCYSQTTG